MNSGIIAEYYVLCELWRNDFRALKSDNPTEKGWDILVLLEQQNIKIQVKAIDWKSTSKVINGNFGGDFDFLVLVLIGFNEKKYTVLVIPKSKFKKRPDTQKNGITDINGNFLYTNTTSTWRTLDIKIHESVFKLYEDKWNQILELDHTIQ
ncbi:hypothetical protein [Clostridium tagluense]|uniref:hypothetical protein n=1 Tax=Clostridium tagluense TaxID=360422 RepID=UPI001CF53615|nr:hypothetical protein [Clostridium tagluense]MCB2297349.1 hypothetical protein [Clostridium tagluense]